MDWFTSDFHFNEVNTAYYRGFDDVKSMNQVLLNSLEVIKPRDRFFFLGDIGRGDVSEFINYVTVKKKAFFYWIEGNHDKEIVKKIASSKKLFKHQHMLIKENTLFPHPIFISHFPSLVYDKSHYGAFQLHGHGHSSTVDKPILDTMIFGKRLNVNIELNNYKLWSREEVEEFMKSRPANLDYLILKGEHKEEIDSYLSKIYQITQDFYRSIPKEEDEIVPEKQFEWKSNN